MSTMKMPSSYNVMNEEEMTYTQGGSWLTFIPGVPGQIADLALIGISVYNEIWAAGNIGKFVKSHKGQDTSATLNAAINQFGNYLQKDVGSAIVGVYSVCNQFFWWPVTAVYCLITAA